MEVRFHRRVQKDLNEVLKKYSDISIQLGEDFLAEFHIGVSRVAENPRRFHFERSGLRRCNLERFPYNFLYDIQGEYVRIWVLRHNRRDPEFGLDRVSR